MAAKTMPLNNVQALLQLPPDFRVTDALEPLEIVVTEADRRLGRPNSPDACAFSVACRRTNGQVIRSEFYKTMAFLVYADVCIRYGLTASAMRLVNDYDEHKGFKPGLYRLIPPSLSHSLGMRKDSGPQSKGINPPPMPRKMRYIRGRKVKANG